MEKIKGLIEELENFKEKINAYLEAATMEAEDMILEMNMSQLYDSGEKSNGVRITPEYAPSTVQRKKKKGQPTNRVTLRDSFDWQSSFFIHYNPDGFEIKAADWKTEILKKRYGDEILGLQDEMVNILCDDVYIPALITELRKSFNYE